MKVEKSLALAVISRKGALCLPYLRWSTVEKRPWEKGRRRKRELERWTHGARRNVLLWRTPDHVHIWEKRASCLQNAWRPSKQAQREALEYYSLFSRLFPDKWKTQTTFKSWPFPLASFPLGEGRILSKTDFPQTFLTSQLYVGI